VAEIQLENLVNFAKENLSQNINTIFELGARDCSETLEFNKIFPSSHIYTFECNKNTLPICRKRTRNIKNITLIEKAVSDKNSNVKFFPINKELTETTWEDGNQGASSLFQASGKYPVENYVQDEITVKSTRLDTVIKKNGIKSVDLLWMDIQGAELLALKGLGSEIHKVKIIHTEVEFFEIYKDQPLFKDIKRYLNRKGYLLASFTNFGEYSGDAIFIKMTELKPYKMPYHILKDLLLYHKKKRFPQLQSLHKRFIGGLKDFKKKLINRFQEIKVVRFLRFLTTYRIQGKPILSLYRALEITKLKFAIISKKDQSLFGTIRKEHTIDVVIPVAIKDYESVALVVDSIKKYLKHKIETIYIVAEKNETITDICRENGLRFISEDTINGISKKRIQYTVKGIDRSGWLYQQFIKLSVEKISPKKYVFICDADTLLCRPQRLIYKNHVIFNHSDEYHQPYYDAYYNIVRQKTSYPLSFVAHYMMIDTAVLKELKKKIQQVSNHTWDEAILEKIDMKEFSSFSEYETYGNFYCSKMKAGHSYWNNVNLAGENIMQLDYYVKNVQRKIKSISFHKHEQIS